MLTLKQILSIVAWRKWNEFNG